MKFVKFGACNWFLKCYNTYEDKAKETRNMKNTFKSIYSEINGYWNFEQSSKLWALTDAQAELFYMFWELANKKLEAIQNS